MKFFGCGIAALYLSVSDQVFHFFVSAYSAAPARENFIFVWDLVLLLREGICPVSSIR
jgi:hypothetical protein